MENIVVSVFAFMYILCISYSGGRTMIGIKKYSCVRALLSRCSRSMVYRYTNHGAVTLASTAKHQDCSWEYTV